MITAAGARLHFAAIAVGDRRGFLTTVVAAAFGDVDFAADDGLDVAFRSFIKTIGGSQKIAVARDGHSRHLLARGLVEKLGSFARPVEKAEIGMNVKMNKLRNTHGR